MATKQLESRVSMIDLLKSPQALIVCSVIIGSFYTLGFLEATLAFQLEQFHLSPTLSGATFMSWTTAYAVVAIICGWISDKKQTFYPFLIAGSVMLIPPLLLIGPSPLVPIQRAELWLLLVCLAVIGTGVGATMTPALNGIYAAARRLGFDDGLELDGLVAGLFNGSLHAGLFLGPTIGSPVMQLYGFEWAATLNAGFALCSATSLLTYVTTRKACQRKNDSKISTSDLNNCETNTTDLNQTVTRDTHCTEHAVAR